MAQYLSPGVFIQEFSSDTPVTTSASPSTLGAVGFTPMGPANVATLVTSYTQFQSVFGGLTRNSMLGYNMAAFFNNGGNRAYVVRVLPSNATKATGAVQSKTTNQSIATGDGTTVAFSATGMNTTLKVNSGASPISASSFSVSWRKAGSILSGEALVKRDGTTAVVGDTATVNFEFRVNPVTSIQPPSPGLLVVVPGTASLKWNDGSSRVLAIGVPSGSATTGTATGLGATVLFDYATGIGSVTFTTPPTATAITLGYTAASATTTLKDDGAGNIVNTGGALTGNGTLNYTTGAYSFTCAAAQEPHNKSLVLVSYRMNDFFVAPVAAGVWGDNIQVAISGSPDTYVAATAQYSKFDVQIQYEQANGSFSTVETYEDLVATPTTDPAYFGSVINAASSFITVTEPAGNEIPGQIQGIAQSIYIGGGDGTSASKAFALVSGADSFLAVSPVAKRTVTISYTDTTAVARTITDDGNGNLIGSVGAGTNTINYTTGAITLTTANSVQAGSLVNLAYVSAPSQAQHLEQLGDTTKGYAQGTDGTFDSMHWGRTQLTDPNATNPVSGMYSLDTVDDILNVIIPDGAGDITMTGDQLDYAATHAELPSGANRFIVLTTPSGETASQAGDWLRYDLARNSDYAAVYWPWIKVADTLSNGRPFTIPPLGHVAGIYARTDQNKNVAKAPAGTVDGALNYLVDLERKVLQSDRDTVYPLKINPFIRNSLAGTAVWGALTISATTDWKFVPVRRMFMTVENSVYNSTQWAVFEDNGPLLWARIKSQLNGYLGGLFAAGWFKGTTANQAFFVICDDTNNTQDTIDQGQLNVTVGIAPYKPATFLVFSFTQIASS